MKIPTQKNNSEMRHKIKFKCLGDAIKIKMNWGENFIRWAFVWEEIVEVSIFMVRMKN